MKKVKHQTCIINSIHRNIYISIANHFILLIKYSPCLKMGIITGDDLSDDVRSLAPLRPGNYAVTGILMNSILIDR